MPINYHDKFYEKRKIQLLTRMNKFISGETDVHVLYAIKNAIYNIKFAFLLDKYIDQEEEISIYFINDDRVVIAEYPRLFDPTPGDVQINIIELKEYIKIRHNSEIRKNLELSIALSKDKKIRALYNI